MERKKKNESDQQAANKDTVGPSSSTKHPVADRQAGQFSQVGQNAGEETQHGESEQRTRTFSSFIDAPSKSAPEPMEADDGGVQMPLGAPPAPISEQAETQSSYQLPDGPKSQTGKRSSQGKTIRSRKRTAMHHAWQTRGDSDANNDSQEGTRQPARPQQQEGGQFTSFTPPQPSPYTYAIALQQPPSTAGGGCGNPYDSGDDEDDDDDDDDGDGNENREGAGGDGIGRGSSGDREQEENDQPDRTIASESEPEEQAILSCFEPQKMDTGREDVA